MAVVNIPDHARVLTDPAEVTSFLASQDIQHERWSMDQRAGADAPAEEILQAYAPELDRLKAAGGYVTADVIDVNSSTPNLEVLLEKFRKEHTHSEDEVRFILRGRGLFFIHPKNGGPVFSILVEAGDLIRVPAFTQHWFDLCSDKSIRAIRLFQDPSGWTPAYMDNGVHAKYEPLCFGPTQLAGAR